MSKQATDRVVTSCTGDGETLSVDLTFVNQASPGAASVVPLGNGNNIINIPAGTAWVTIVPPIGSVTAKSLKGVGADTGVPLNPAMPIKFAPLAGTLNFVLSCGGSENVMVYFT